MGSVEDPDFAKQNDSDSAAGPFAYLPTKLLKQGFDVLPRQAAAYRSGEDQLKGALVLPLYLSRPQKAYKERAWESRSMGNCR